MPTNGERHTVAENLRYEVDYPWRPIQYMEQFIVDLREIIFNDPTSVADYSEMLSRLADLIEPEPERTCRMVPMPFNGAPPYRRSNVVLDGMTDGCSECGYPIKARLRETPNFCPNCGAKVVIDE